MKIEDIEKAGKIYIENLLDYHIDYTIINNEEDNYETGREHALSEFGADIFKAGAEWMKKIFFVGKCIGEVRLKNGDVYVQKELFEL